MGRFLAAMDAREYCQIASKKSLELSNLFLLRRRSARFRALTLHIDHRSQHFDIDGLENGVEALNQIRVPSKASVSFFQGFTYFIRFKTP